jgi:hypothetical protein
MLGVTVSLANIEIILGMSMFSDAAICIIDKGHSVYIMFKLMCLSLLVFFHINQTMHVGHTLEWSRFSANNNRGVCY